MRRLTGMAALLVWVGLSLQARAEAVPVVLVATGILVVVGMLRWKDRRERNEMNRLRGQMLRQERLAGCAEFV